MSVVRWAEFIGFQKDDRIRGVRPFFILHAEDSDRNNSTVFTETIRRFGIPIPPIPDYEPDTFIEQGVAKCETCQITWLSVDFAVEHKRQNRQHQMSSYTVPVANNMPFDQEPSRIWVRDEIRKTLVEEKPFDDESTQPIEEKDLPKPKGHEYGLEYVSEFVKKMKKQYPFLKGDK